MKQEAQQATIRKISQTTNKYSGVPAIQVLFELKGTGEGKELVKTINVNRNKGTQYASFLRKTGIEVSEIDTFEQFQKGVEGKEISIEISTRRDGWKDVLF